MKDWKSTAAGVLSFLITTLTTISAFLVAGNLTAGGPGVASVHVSTWVVVGVNVALALCRAWVGLITNNADAGAVALALSAPTASPAAKRTADTLTKAVPALLLGLLLIGGLGLSGCSSFERDTFNSLAASKAVIDQAQVDYTAGTIKETSCSYAVINDAKAVQTVAVNAMVLYEQEKLAGKNLEAQTAAVTVDVAEIVPVIVQVKALYTNPAGCTTPKS